MRFLSTRSLVAWAALALLLGACDARLLIPVAPKGCAPDGGSSAWCEQSTAAKGGAA